MARSTARANGRSQPRETQQQSETQVTQTQRRRRREEDEAEDDEEVGGDEEEAAIGENEENDEAQDEMTRKANALVRLALFNESRHTPLRRDEINKKVLGDNTRQFNHVFSLANKILQSTFGMELVELMSRADLDREQNANDEVQDDANATGLKKKATASGSKSYILRSTLAQELIQIAAEADEEILEIEIDEAGDEEGLEGDDDDAPTTYGSIINWTSADQLGGLGLLYVILSLILVNGHSMSDPELKTHLKTFRLPMSAPIEFVPHATHRNMSIESYLSSLVKQGQLDKVKISSSGAPRPTQGKRGRAGANEGDDPDSAATYEWRWGPRAHAEVGERAVAEFIAEFMAERSIRDYEKSSGVEDGEENGDEGEGVGERGRRIADKDREKLLSGFLKDITRAAGGKVGELTGVVG